MDHLGDVISKAIDRVLYTMSKLGPLGVAAVTSGLVAAVLAVRALRNWLERWRRRRPRSGARARTNPLPSFIALTDALTSVGHERDASEPLESFARRLASVDTPWATNVSNALVRYAALRYGALGDEAAIASEVERAARKVRNTRDG
jgi:hypothetical protein